MKVFYCCDIEVNDFGYGEIFNVPVNMLNVLTIGKDCLTVYDHIEQLHKSGELKFGVEYVNLPLGNILYRILFNMKGSEVVTWLFESEESMMFEYNKLLKLEK